MALKLALLMFPKEEGERERKEKLPELGLLEIQNKGTWILGCGEVRLGWDVLESVLGWGVQGIKSEFGSVLLSTVSRTT